MDDPEHDFDGDGGPTPDTLSAEEHALLDELAALNPVAYARRRQSAAQRLRIGVGFLDREVRRRQTSQGEVLCLNLPEYEPADDSVDGQRVLEQLTTTLQRYVVLRDDAAHAIALWIVRAHAHDAFDVNARLALVSPTKRCGKTQLLELLSCLTPRPLLTSNVTPAAVYRAIEKYHPTLLVDEFDALSARHNALRGILNSGHRRTSASVMRCVGEGHLPEVFSTWCPMVVATIVRLPDTLRDRSIVIPMARRKPAELIGDLRWIGPHGDMLRLHVIHLHRALARWVLDHQDALRTAQPKVPEGLHDRAADNWHPLCAIAEILGGPWPERARVAAQVLSAQDWDEEGVEVKLLADVRQIFTAMKVSRLSSADLCERLVKLEERPWSEVGGRQITPLGLARLLRPFGVRPRNFKRPDGRVIKGYDATEMQDVWERYTS